MTRDEALAKLLERRQELEEKLHGERAQRVVESNLLYMTEQRIFDLQEELRSLNRMILNGKKKP